MTKDLFDIVWVLGQKDMALCEKMLKAMRRSSYDKRVSLYNSAVLVLQSALLLALFR